MKKTGQEGGELKRNRNRQQSKESFFLNSYQLNVPNLFIRLFLRITVPGAFIVEKNYHYCFLILTVFCSHTKHAWNSCNYREHASLASLFCAIRAHHYQLYYLYSIINLFFSQCSKLLVGENHSTAQNEVSTIKGILDNSAKRAKRVELTL